MDRLHVPLISRGSVIEDADLEFAARGAGVRFTTPDIGKHLGTVLMSEPSAMVDLHDLGFGEILEYLGDLGHQLTYSSNRHLQEAFEFARLTSSLTDSVLMQAYTVLGRVYFNPSVIEQSTDASIGLRYLEGWVPHHNEIGEYSIRAFGARTAHVIAGNVPSVAAISIVRNAVTRSDALIKAPSNDLLTAGAIVRTMIDMAPDHPLTRHVSVGYWKGGDAEIESQIYSPGHIEKIVAWGGLASVRHIAKYVQPGIDLVTLDPKLSSSIIGKQAFIDEQTMLSVANRLAHDVGVYNQEGCLCARVVYIQTGSGLGGLEMADRFGELLFDAVKSLPPTFSSAARRLDSSLADEIEGIRLTSDEHRVIGGGPDGAVIVSHTSEPVDFADLLANRVVNLVPVDDLELPVRSTNCFTQTIGVYPNELKADLRDRVAFRGAQRIVSLGHAIRSCQAGPQDGIEPLRRMCKWIIDENFGVDVPLPSVMEVSTEPGVEALGALSA